MEHADNLIKKSMKFRSSSKEQRERICQLLADSASSLARQWNIVNAAFTDRIRDYMDAKHKLEMHLAKADKFMLYSIFTSIICARSLV
jgi:Tektin family